MRHQATARRAPMRRRHMRRRVTARRLRIRGRLTLRWAKFRSRCTLRCSRGTYRSHRHRCTHSPRTLRSSRRTHSRCMHRSSRRSHRSHLLRAYRSVASINTYRGRIARHARPAGVNARPQPIDERVASHEHYRDSFCPLDLENTYLSVLIDQSRP